MKEESSSVFIYEIPPEILAQARVKEKDMPSLEQVNKRVTSANKLSPSSSLVLTDSFFSRL